MALALADLRINAWALEPGPELGLTPFLSLFIATVSLCKMVNMAQRKITLAIC